MANPDAVLTVNFNMKLDAATDDKLIMLANERHQPKAATVRDLIRTGYAMTIEMVPTCANGTECRCPHAHVRAPQLPPVNPPEHHPADDA